MTNATANIISKKIETVVSFQLPAKLIALTAGCNVETVKATRRLDGKGKRVTGPKAKKAAMVDAYLHDELGKLMGKAKDL